MVIVQFYSSYLEQGMESQMRLWVEVGHTVVVCGAPLPAALPPLPLIPSTFL